MSINGFYLMPHPPIVIPEVGRGEEQKIVKTSEAMDELGKEIARKAPNTIIVITPHGTMFQDAIAIAFENSLKGSLHKFGVSEVSLTTSINKPLASRVFELSMQEDIPVVMTTDELLKPYNASLEIDHGTLVPLYFITKYYKNYKLIHITYAPISDIELYKFGMLIAKAVEDMNENAVLIASGDLSHRLKAEGPYDYSPYGEKFDKEFLNNLTQGDVLQLFNMDKETVCSAGECGRRSALIMLGALEGKNFRGELLSYEGTFGVGYGVMKLTAETEGISILEKLEALKVEAHKKKLNQQNPYVKLARESLTTYLTTGDVIKSLPDYVTEEMKNTRRGVFVSLKKYGELRGCIGTFLPTTNSVAEEIIRNAIEAGIDDPRFCEVTKDELLDIDFSVDVLTEPEPASKEELNPREYGVIVASKGRRGLLLPDLEGVDTVEEQLSIAAQKAGIGPKEPYSIEKFKVIRHKEE